MAELSDFKWGQIFGARMAGDSVRKIAELFGVARRTISKVMRSFEKEGKTSSLKQNFGRKRKLWQGPSDSYVDSQEYSNQKTILKYIF